MRPSPISVRDGSPAPRCCASNARSAQSAASAAPSRPSRSPRPYRYRGPVPSESSSRSRATPRAAHRARRVQPQGDLRRSDPRRRRCWARSAAPGTTAAHRFCRRRATARRSERAMASRSSTEVNRAACTASALPAGAGTPTASIRSNLPCRSQAITRAPKGVAWCLVAPVSRPASGPLKESRAKSVLSSWCLVLFPLKIVSNL